MRRLCSASVLPKRILGLPTPSAVMSLSRSPEGHTSLAAIETTERFRTRYTRPTGSQIELRHALFFEAVNSRANRLTNADRAQGLLQ